jgi:hypothetical protein
MKIVEGLFEVVKKILHFQLHDYAVNVGFDVFPNLGFQDDVNTLLIRCAPVFEPECQLCVAEDPERCDEHYFFFIVNSKADLMIA